MRKYICQGISSKVHKIVSEYNLLLLLVLSLFSEDWVNFIRCPEYLLKQTVCDKTFIDFIAFRPSVSIRRWFKYCMHYFCHLFVTFFVFDLNKLFQKLSGHLFLDSREKSFKLKLLSLIFPKDPRINLDHLHHVNQPLPLTHINDHIPVAIPSLSHRLKQLFQKYLNSQLDLMILGGSIDLKKLI